MLYHTIPSESLYFIIRSKALVISIFKKLLCHKAYKEIACWSDLFDSGESFDGIDIELFIISNRITIGQYISKFEHHNAKNVNSRLYRTKKDTFDGADKMQS